MKTEISSKNNFETEKIDPKCSSENRGVRGTRRTLQALQTAAGDKENLVGGGRMGKPSGPLKEVTIVVADSKSSGKKVKKWNITAEDLTSEDGPSEGYWEAVAERRRLALEEALEENQELRERIRLLEEENEQCKILLDETRTLVETFNEMLNDQQPENDDKEKQETEE